MPICSMRGSPKTAQAIAGGSAARAAAGQVSGSSAPVDAVRAALRAA